MSPRIFSSAAFLLLALLAGSVVLGEQKDTPKKAAKDSGVVGGLVIDKHDDSIIVQVDGEEEPTKYLIGQGTDKRSLETLKGIFSVARVNVKFKVEGGAHRLVAIEKVVGKPTGIFTGEVLKVYNNFWVAVKPKNGPPDGFALNWPPEKFKASFDLIKTLKPGDIVAIKYTTDFERHRIQQMEVKPAPVK